MSGEGQSRLSACVVLYGGPEEARACLASLAAHTTRPLDLYLVDNASPGLAPGELEKGLPAGARVLRQAENRGYGAGHNAVLPLLNSAYHAVVNPDILLEGPALDEMAAWMDAHPEVAITAPRLVFPDGREQALPRRRPALLPLVARQTGWRFLQRYDRRYRMLDEDLTQPTDVEFCSGSFFLIRTDVFKAMGGFDEGYFMYVEDADITMKALGYGRAVYLPQVTVCHAWHRAAHRRLKPFLWQLRSMLRYWRKWGLRIK